MVLKMYLNILQNFLENSVEDIKKFLILAGCKPCEIQFAPLRLQSELKLNWQNLFSINKFAHFVSDTKRVHAAYLCCAKLT